MQRFGKEEETMSRIGRAPIQLPSNVKFDNKDNLITISGPLGTLTQEVAKSITVECKDNVVTVARASDEKEQRALHGLYRALINNMVIGVSKGFEKTLVAQGVGYKINLQGNNKLVMDIGFSHQVEFVAPAGIKFEIRTPLEVTVIGCDRQVVGQTAASLKAIKKIEPYHGYGFHYKDEKVVLKPGKASGK